MKKILVSKNTEFATNGKFKDVSDVVSGKVFNFTENSRLVLTNEFFKGTTVFKEFIFHDSEKELRVKFPYLYAHEDCYVKWVTDFIDNISSIDALKCLFILGKYEYEQY